MISETDRIASSFPAMAIVSLSGSAFVSAMATTGISNRFASRTAISSLFASTTKTSPDEHSDVKKL